MQVPRLQIEFLSTYSQLCSIVCLSTTQGDPFKGEWIWKVLERLFANRVERRGTQISKSVALPN